jgi:hypothetical protein
MNRRKSMKQLLIAASFAISVVQGTVLAQRNQLPRPAPTFTATISGTVRLIDCNASPANVRINVGTRSIQPRPIEGNDFVWSYTVSGLRPGTYTVRPAMAISRCRRGAWAPETREVRIESGLASARDVNFEYRGPRTVTRLNAVLLAAIMQTVFDGSQIHLNNFTSRRHVVDGRDSWHLANDSFFTTPGRVGGRTVQFNIPEVSAGPLHYYVNDLNLSRVLVRTRPDAFRLILPFEDRGTEIIGRCSNTTASIDPKCPAGSDSTAPNFEINSATLTVAFTFTRNAAGNLTYGPVTATFEATVRGGGAGSIFEDRLKRELKSRIEETVTRELNRQSLRDAVGEALRPELNRRGIGTVLVVRFEGPDLVIDSYPR